MCIVNFNFESDCQKFDTMGKIDFKDVNKLKDGNYQSWKLQVSLILKSEELWGVVSGSDVKPEDAETRSTWQKKDDKAMAIIVTTLMEKQMGHVYSCETSHAMWEKLKNIHSDHSQLNKNQTLAKFLNYRVRSGQSVVEAFIEIEELARSLKEMGNEQSEETTMMIVLSSLPEPRFTMFKKAWHSVAEEEQSMERLLSRLRLEELEAKGKVETVAEEKASSSSSAAFHIQSKGHGGQRGKGKWKFVL